MKTIFTPAKVNLYLNITGKTTNGYHLIDSLFIPVDIFDTISITKTKTQYITCQQKGKFANAVTAKENIVVKAASLLAKRYNVPYYGLDIILEKNIPVAAGMGGGSSDAASTLKALLKLWQININKEELIKLATEIGADVPFFLNPAPAHVSGIGEIINKITIPKLHIVIVNPGMTLATKQVFERFIYTKKQQETLTYPLIPQEFNEFIAFLHSQNNDLQQTAISIAPIIGKILARIEQQPGCLLARMSGSGPTCFGIFATKKDADNAWHKIKQDKQVIAFSS